MYKDAVNQKSPYIANYVIFVPYRHRSSFQPFFVHPVITYIYIERERITSLLLYNIAYYGTYICTMDTL